MATTTLGTTTVTTEQTVTVEFGNETVVFTGEETAYLVDLSVGAGASAGVHGDMELGLTVTVPADMTVTCNGVEMTDAEIAQCVSAGFVHMVGEIANQ